MKQHLLIRKNAAEPKKGGSINASSDATTRKWFVKFRTDHISTEDNELSRRTKETVTYANNKKSTKLFWMAVKWYEIDKDNKKYVEYFSLELSAR